MQCLIPSSSPAILFFTFSGHIKRLDAGLARVAWPATVIELQRRWIGRSTGADVCFRLVPSGGELRVFTTRPETIFGVTFVAVGADSPLLTELPGAQHL